MNSWAQFSTLVVPYKKIYLPVSLVDSSKEFKSILTTNNHNKEQEFKQIEDTIK